MVFDQIYSKSETEKVRKNSIMHNAHFTPFQKMFFSGVKSKGNSLFSKEKSLACVHTL